MARQIIQGKPGEVWTNDTGRALYQFLPSFANTCGICYQYTYQIGPWWPIPLHWGCRCTQRVVKPGQQAPEPFADFRKLVDDLPDAQRVKVVGASNYRLIKEGVVDWGAVVTDGRIRTLQEVFAREKLSVEDAVNAGVSRSIAERAYSAVHTAEHEAVEAQRKAAADRLAKAGMSQGSLVNELSKRIAARVAIVPGSPGGAPPGAPPAPPVAPVPAPGSGGSTATELAKLLRAHKPVAPARSKPVSKPAPAPKPAPTPAPTPAPPPKPAWQWGQPTNVDRPIAERIKASPAWQRTQEIAKANQPYLEARRASSEADQEYKALQDRAIKAAKLKLSDEEKLELLEQIKAKNAECRRLREARDAAKIAAAAETARILQPPRGTATFGWSADVSELSVGHRYAFRQAEGFLSPILAAGPGKSYDTVSFRTIAKGQPQRARCDDWRRQIHLAQSSEAGTAVHEWGHQIEYSVPGVRAATQEFLEHRVGSETPRPMNELTGRTVYDANEMGREDDFRKAFGDSAAYVGKVYNHASEIVSMGLEKLYNDPGGFARDDPEFCAFVLGILDGSLRKP